LCAGRIKKKSAIKTAPLNPERLLSPALSSSDEERETDFFGLSQGSSYFVRATLGSVLLRFQRKDTSVVKQFRDSPGYDIT